jgi:DUF2911 family protein
MKQLCLFLLIFSCCTGALSQSKATPVDKSPMDMCYYPINYPILKIQNKATEPIFARVIYSRPQKNGRKVLGELVEYGKVWRLGANEATELELYKDAHVGNNKLKKGRYTLYAVPENDKWTIIFNKENDTWGAFQYDQKKDLFRYDVKLEKTMDMTEAFTIMWEKSTDGGANLVFAWDDFRCVVPFGM